LRFDSPADDPARWGGEYFQLENPEEATRVFSKKFHAVVGNPPYITCKDAKLRELYRDAYESAAGKYALSAPFAERFFQLAVDGGYVGMINANSFMKREFGKALVEKVLPNVELTQVIDTAGAYIPGHGTPTVLLFGRNRTPLSDKVSAVLGKRGEPETPADPEQGLVWSSIRDHFRESGFENEYISTAEVSRETFGKHPWSLGGGGAAELKELLEQRAQNRLGEIAVIGIGGMSNADDVYLAENGCWRRRGMPAQMVRTFVIGEEIRDWAHLPSLEVLFPYDHSMSLVALPDAAHRLLWPFRTTLWSRATFSGSTYKQEGRPWWEWHQVTTERYRTPLSIAFAFVATHNHFVLDRGGKVFNRSAPIIKLPEGATEDDHLALLAYLNSSTAAFYFRQAGHSKGIRGEGGGITAETWEQFMEYSAALIGSVPVPVGWQSLSAIGRVIDGLASERQRGSPSALTFGQLTNPAELRALNEGNRELLAKMVAAQESLDLRVYKLWGFDARLDMDPSSVEPGDRNFERALKASGRATRWFSLNDYREPTSRALPTEGIQVALIEQPEFKRRWIVENWDDAVQAALMTQVLDLCEGPYRSSSEILPVRMVADKASEIPTYAGAGPSDLVLETAVPFLASLRYSDSGLAKRAEWEKTWTLQRREDAGEKVEIPVPPKYDSKDFRDPIYWRLRGKLDVPKERFISYPGAEQDDDKSPLYGWAGWDHLQQATALAGLYHERKTEDGWAADRLVPLLAGLLELLPWLKQWHNEPSEDLGGEGAGDWYERYVEAEARSLGKTLDDLREWRPQKGGRGREK
jgi:hypothetical protein